MNKIAKQLVVPMLLACLPLLRSQANAGPKPEQGLRVSIRTYSYAEVPAGTLDVAKRVAASILGRAGIQVAWVDCRTVTETTLSVVTCDRSSETAITDANILLVNRFPAEAKISGARTLGFSVLPGECALADQAYVSLPNVSKFGNDRKAPLDLVLGLVMAHEIVHLLLGQNEHAPTGLMRPFWDKEDLLRAQSGELGLSDEQAKLLRGEVLARSKFVRAPAPGPGDEHQE